MTIQVHVTLDETNKKWRMETTHGSNTVLPSHLAVLINRDVKATDKHFLLRLRHTPGGHAIKFSIASSDPKSINLCSCHYKDKPLVTISGALAKAIHSVSARGYIFIEALSVSADGKRTPAVPMLSPPFVAPPPAVLQPNLPGM